MRSLEEGSAAERARVQRGWILTHWNIKPYGGDTNTSCQPGVEAHLTFVDLYGQEREVDVECVLSTGNSHAVQRKADELEGGVVYLQPMDFHGAAGEWIIQQVEKHITAPAIIMDLRRNGGGEFAVVQKCLKPFFSPATVFGEVRDRNGRISARLTVRWIHCRYCPQRLRHSAW